MCYADDQIDDQAYQILQRLKQGKSDSFSSVIKRNYQVIDTCGELIDWIESAPRRRSTGTGWKVSGNLEVRGLGENVERHTRAG
jgi:hypothetical protein